MIYPNGVQVTVGDHIWWNGGTCIGFVRTIVEEETDIQAWGLEEPHIVISGVHPMDADDAGYVSYPSSVFDDDGIARLTSEEEQMIGRAEIEIRSQVGYREPYLIGVVCRDCKAEALTFSSFDGHKTTEFGRIPLSK